MQIYLANILGIGDWVWVAVAVLILFGGTKIPELMRGVGKGVGELQKGIADGKEQIESLKSEK